MEAIGLGAEGGSGDAAEVRAFLIADVRGYTTYTQDHGDAAAAVLASRFAEIGNAGVAAFGGVVLGLRGDELAASFGSPRQALRAAIGLQRRFAEELNRDPSLPLRVGIGLDAGEAVPVEDGYRGGALNLAARLCSLARAGEVLVSDSLAHLVGKIDEASYRDRGRLRVKGLDKPVQVWRAEFGLELPSALPRPARLISRRLAVLLTAIAVLVTGATAAAITWFGHANPQLLPENTAGLFDSSGHLKEFARLGVAPTAAAYGVGAVWVTNGADNRVSKIDLASGSVVPIPIGTGVIGTNPAGVAVDAGTGTVWVADSGDGTLTEINPRVVRAVGSPIRVGNGPDGVAIGAGKVWVANSLDGTVVQVDPNTLRRKTIPVGPDPTRIAYGGGAVWVTLESTSSVVRIDPLTGSVSEPIRVGHGPNAITYGDRSVWIANSLDGRVWRMSPNAPYTVEHVYQVGSDPEAIAIAGEVVWVANNGSGDLTRLDLAADTTRTIRLGGNPTGLVATPRGVWVAVGAAAGLHRGGTLRLVIGGPGTIDTIDPATSFSIGGWSNLDMTNDGLVGFKRVGGPHGETLVADLAKSLPIPADNGKTYTFTLRRGIHYSTGAVVKPEDIRRELERVFQSGSPGMQFYTGIVGAQPRLAGAGPPGRYDLSRGIVTNDHANTVTFHLRAPDSEFLDKLALPFADAVPANAPAPGGTRALPATGPYMVKSYTPKTQVVLGRNPYFREWSRDAQPAGFPDKITWKLNATLTGATRDVEQGRADWSGLGLPGDQTHQVETRFASQLHTNLAPAIVSMFLNTQVAPFRDVRVRRALNYAVNRQVAADLSPIGAVRPLPTCQILPPNTPGYQPTCPYTQNPSPAGVWASPNLAAAHRLVRKSGTSGIPVAVWIPAGQGFSPLGRYFARLLHDLGYPTSVHAVSPDRYSAQVPDSTRRVQIGVWTWALDYPTASDLLNLQLTCHSFTPNSANNANVAEFCNHANDRLVAHALDAQLTNPGAAGRLWAHIDRLDTRQAPWVPIFTPVASDFLSPRTGNYQYNPALGGVLLDQLWVK